MPPSSARRMSLSVATTSSVRVTTSCAIDCGMTTTPSRSPRKVIAGRDGHGADRDRLAEGVGDPALDNVGGRQKRAEHREALSENKLGIARAAVDDVAQNAARLKRLRRELAHERDLMIVRLAHDHMTGRCLGQHRAPREERLIARASAIDVAGDSPRRSGKARSRRDRLDLGRQHGCYQRAPS